MYKKYVTHNPYTLSDGVGRTGTFICIHAQLERLKTEGVVDFFQFVKSARMQRPGVILNRVSLPTMQVHHNNIICLLFQY